MSGNADATTFRFTSSWMNVWALSLPLCLSIAVMSNSWLPVSSSAAMCGFVICLRMGVAIRPLGRWLKWSATAPRNSVRQRRGPMWAVWAEEELRAHPKGGLVLRHIFDSSCLARCTFVPSTLHGLRRVVELKKLKSRTFKLAPQRWDQNPCCCWVTSFNSEPIRIPRVLSAISTTKQLKKMKMVGGRRKEGRKEGCFFTA